MKTPQQSSIPMVDEATFEQEVLSSEIPVFVDFQAVWCAPCKMTEPEIEAVAGELQGKIKFVKVDIDKSPSLAAQLRVQSVPTFMVFHQGRLVGGKVGALRRQQIRQMLEPLIPRIEGAIRANEAQILHREGKIVFVDTRDAPTYRRVHLPGAVHMPLEEIRTRLAELHMLAGFPVLYCRAGDKTKVLVEQLAGEGIEVGFLEGGVIAWETEGLPIERPS